MADRTLTNPMTHIAVIDWLFGLLRESYGMARQSLEQVRPAMERELLLRSTDNLDRILTDRDYRWETLFQNRLVIKSLDGSPDWITTVFYLVNCIQEYHELQKDHYDRVDPIATFQGHFDVLTVNLVDDYIRRLLEGFGIEIPTIQSRVFVSHDVDSLYGSLKFDGLWALKTANIPAMMKVIALTLLRRPPWFNIDRVMALEDEYDIKACYYWIVSHGRDGYGIKNGDYNIESRAVQNCLSSIRARGHHLGLHKSTLHTSFLEERSRLDNTIHNRNHFLKLDVAEDWISMEDAGIKTDSSLGYASQMGWRNSFGLPFRPFALQEQRTLDLMVVPLSIMDGMLPITDSSSAEYAKDSIIRFIDANRYNAVMGILWHNSEMTPFAYGASYKVYKELLGYFYDSGLETVSIDELLDENRSRR